MTSNELQTRRTALKLSQTELARRLAVRQQTISEWEVGKIAIQHPTMLDLALRALEAEAKAGK